MINGYHENFPCFPPKEYPFIAIREEGITILMFHCSVNPPPRKAQHEKKFTEEWVGLKWEERPTKEIVAVIVGTVFSWSAD